MHQDSVSDGEVVCVLCVPVLPASCSSARRRSQWEPHRAKGGCVMPLWRKRTHTHTLSATAHSLGSKNCFLHYLQVIKLTDEQHLTQLAGRFPAMLSGYHLMETSKNQ